MKKMSDKKEIATKHFCQICDSAYVETTQKNVEYVCRMCRNNIISDNDTRSLPNENDIITGLVTDYGNT